jgi:hypothetical protein
MNKTGVQDEIRTSFRYLVVVSSRIMKTVFTETYLQNTALKLTPFDFVYNTIAEWGRGELFTGFWLGGPKGRNHWKDLGVGGRITLRWVLGRLGSMGRNILGWLRIGSSGEPL